ncbi:uncharacterized protein LOC135157293 [Lytechinus pictus]|uniref:uncharacterized protein LOC135157293 n=1 Tax=Lytechinus pictus TaxID=7653 RepID=UPI0030BA0E21
MSELVMPNISGSDLPENITSVGKFLWIRFTSDEASQETYRGFDVSMIAKPISVETLTSDHNVLIITSVSVTVLALLSFSVFGYITWKKRTKEEQDDGQQEGHYMDLTPSVTSSPTYEALGAVRLSKIKESPTYENKSVVRHHQNIHGITAEDEHPYELPN